MSDKHKISIRFFNDREVRAVWDDEQGKWFFSIVDIVAAITNSPRPRVYWGTVKNRQKAQNGQLYSKCIQLKLMSADGNHSITSYSANSQPLKTKIIGCNVLLPSLASVVKCLALM